MYAFIRENMEINLITNEIVDLFCEILVTDSGLANCEQRNVWSGFVVQNIHVNV